MRWLPFFGFLAEKGLRIREAVEVRWRDLHLGAGLGVWIVDKRARGGWRAESWVGFHTFHQTCATVLFRSGWNAAQVCRHLGHSDAGFTLRTYVHLLDADVPEPSILDGLSGNRMATRATETGRNDLAALAVESA